MEKFYGIKWGMSNDGYNLRAIAEVVLVLKNDPLEGAPS